MKSAIFFQRFMVKSVGIFSVVYPYLALNALILIMHLTHNSYNGGKKYLSHQFFYKFQLCDECQILNI
jgi:hypothetical protein